MVQILRGVAGLHRVAEDQRTAAAAAEVRRRPVHRTGLEPHRGRAPAGRHRHRLGKGHREVQRRTRFVVPSRGHRIQRQHARRMGVVHRQINRRRRRQVARIRRHHSERRLARKVFRHFKQ